MRLITIASFLSVSLFAASGHAAPQILALITTNDAATPLHCEAGVCKAEFSAFCLQKNRDTPAAMTPYRPAEGADVHFVVTAPDGSQRTVPATGLSIRSVNAYTSVVIGVSEDRVRALGGAVALRVGSNVTLVPEPQENDPNPLTEAEIAHATSTLRSMGTSYVDREGKVADAVRLSMRMINEVSSTTGLRELQPVKGLVDRVLASEDIRADSREMLRQRLSRCNTMIEGEWRASGLRLCMRIHHEKMVDTLNWPYWDATRTGM